MHRTRYTLTPAAVHYAWRQLAQRSGIATDDIVFTGFRDLGHLVHYGTPRNFSNHKPSILVIPCSKSALFELVTHPSNKLHWLSAQEVMPRGSFLLHDAQVPVLLWGEGYEDGSMPFVKRNEDGTVIFYADIIAATFFMLSRWEETVVPIRDEHDRFPAAASVAYKQGFLDRPIVDEYALVLQAWIKTLLPGWIPEPGPFSIKLSHDIDTVRCPSLRALGRDLLKRDDLRQVIRSLSSLLLAKEDAYTMSIYTLAKLSEEHGLKSAFYFMSATRGAYDNGYDPASPVVCRCIDELRSRGHEIGFHPGYRTMNDPDLFACEKARLDAVLGENQHGGRQHYLRFRIPTTWRQWEMAGLTYDSSLSYADYEGFRCGTCHPFQPFDVEKDRELDILEIPLVVMDGTLRQYRKITPEQGEERILTLAQRCKQVNGCFTLLWHNSSLVGEWEPWGVMYRRVLARLSAMEGI